MIKTLLVTCLLFLLSKSGDSQDIYVVHPSLSPDGNQLAFSYQGDIWTMSVDESIPRRLTIHESYEHSPMWSPDGKSLAFVGNRWGNNDIYTIAVDGGSPKRLTYHSAGDDRPSWVSNDRILFTSRRNFAQAERESEIWSVSVTGGTPERYVDAVGLSPHMQANGNLLAFVRGNCRTAREAYRGPANRQVWTYNSADGNYNQVTTDEGQDILPKIIEDYVYFLSARSGVYNLHRVQSTTPNEIEQITNFDSEGITHYDVSADNSALIFTRGGQTYFQKIGDDEGLRQLTFDVPGDERFDQIVHRTVTNQALSYALSPDEEQMAFEVRGELFLKKNDKDKSRAKQLTKHAFRDKQPVWVNDSVLIFSSDREGTFDLYALTSGSEEKDLYETFDLDVRRLTNDGTEEEGLSLSPDRSQLIYREGRGRLVLMDVDSLGTLTNRRVLLDGWDTPGGVTWSPDGKWIAYSLSDLDFNEEIYIHSIEEDLPPVNVSLHPRSDYSPKWSKDGSKLGFLSERNNGDTDVWFVWLSKSDWDKTQRDWEDEEDQEVEEDSVLTVQIDFERIHERLVQVTSLAGNEGDLSISHDGETFYFTDDGGSWQGGGGTSDFYSIKWDGDDLTKIITDISLYASSHDEKGKHIYAIRSGGSLIKIDPKAKKQETLSFKGRMDIDYPQERQQVFDEAWRRLRDGFYDPEFHGYDWSALRERYEDRCLAASTQQDFRRFINEMLGQLNASHMGVYGGSREETQREQTGLLGIDYSVETNGIRIQRVIPEGPADREE
ncbi:MAG: peptidase S41, partial [Bacteroidota bacterium]